MQVGSFGSSQDHNMAGILPGSQKTQEVMPHASQNIGKGQSFVDDLKWNGVLYVQEWPCATIH